ncbi:MAG: NHL repeat-containing protein [Planctomycetota bacterium]|jgi:sugar lactone lactonase YvrE
MNKRNSWILPAIAVLCLFAFVGPGTATDVDPDYRRATISPSLIRLKRGRKQKFKVVMSPPYLRPAYVTHKVKWSVNDIPGGNKKLGTIDAAGLYKAPARAPKPHEIHICAEVQEASNRHLWATVLIGNPDPSYKLIRTWPEPADTPTYFERPHGIAFDKEGNILIADQNNSRVMRFTPEGKYLGEIGSGQGKEPGKFNEPRLAIADADGRIWVSDSKMDEPRIQVFTPDGKFIRWFAHNSRGRLFVVDVDNFCVNVYSRSGQFLYAWGKPGLQAGEFNAPHGLTVDPSDDVFVSNYYSPIQKFDPNGSLLFAFAHADPPDGPVGYHSIAGDRVHIAKYNNNGDYITAWSLAEPDQYVMWFAIDDDGLVYCLFTGQKLMGVQVYAPQ